MSILSNLIIPAICLFAQGQDSLPVYHAGTVYSYGNAVSIYPEGFVRARGQKLLADGKAATSIRPGTDSAVVILTDQDGNSASERINLVCTRPDAVSGKGRALVLCVGESTTETQNPDPVSGSFERGGNWVGMMQATSRTHGTDVLCLGTRNGSTAHGGWSSYTYLNWPCAAKMDPGAPKHFFSSETMWYALGLQGITGKAFNKEAWQYDMMAGTPFGKYPVDEHPSLLEFAKSVSGRYGYPVFDGSLQDWAEELATDPVNEFYSPEAAREGQFAFSLEKYLERYRTLDDSGNRLESRRDNPSGQKVRGKDGKFYTIGTRIVTRALLSKVSVCRPTQVVVNIGINDGDSASSVPATAVALENLLGCFGSLPVAHFVMRWPGACYPALWSPGYLPRQYSVNGNNDRVMAIMGEVAEWASDKEDISLLDVWHCQSPVSQHKEKYSGGVLDCSLDDVHTGYYGQMSAADQVLGWLYRCLLTR